VAGWSRPGACGNGNPMAEETKDSSEQAKPEEIEIELPESVETPDDDLPKNTVAVEDAGTLRKKVTVTVSRERIDAKSDELFGELGRNAPVPGFRVGHAPRRLIEKRFGKEVSEDVRNGLVGDAVGSAIEDEKLKVLGEPDIDLEEIKLPEGGELTFSFEVEVAPEFDLPEYKGLKIERPDAEVTDELVESALRRMLEPMGRLIPVDGAAKEGDTIVADVKLTGDGIEFAADAAEFRVAPAQVQGVPLEDLGKAIAGKKAGQSCSLKDKVPAGHPNEQWRDKDVEVSIAIKEVKRLEIPELTDDLARTQGFDSVGDLREAARRSLDARLESDKIEVLRDQLRKRLLDGAQFDLPEKLSDRHTERVLSRRYVDLMMRGAPREELDGSIDRLRAEAAEQAATALKLSFILSRLAEEEQVEVEEAELNARITEIARRQNRRPERFRQELAGEGRLEQLVSGILEEKTLDKILEYAEIVDAKPDKPAEKAEKAKKPKKSEKAKPAGKGAARKKPAADKKPAATKKPGSRKKSGDEGES
jgi:trigger factor